MKRGTAYASIGVVLGLVLVLASFVILSVDKEQLTGAAVFGHTSNSETVQEDFKVPAGTVRLVTNGKVLYVAQESMAPHSNYCSYGNMDERCPCPAGFEQRVVENYYMCIKIF